MKKQKVQTTQSAHAGANARLIGAFMMGAIALIVVVFLVFGGGDFFKDKVKYVIYFRGSVDGLNTGAPVKIRGVQIGSVTEVNPMMHENGDFIVEVIIETVGGTIREAMSEGTLKKSINGIEDMIKNGLRAQLQSQSFIVAQKMVVVDYYPDTDTIFARLNQRYKEIPSIPAKSEELEQSLQHFITQLEEVPFAEIGKSVQSATAGIDTFFKTLKLQMLIENINRNFSGVGGLVTRMDSLSLIMASSLNTTSNTATNSLKNFDLLTKRLENLATENQYLLKQTLEQVSSAARSMKNLMDYLQQHPSDILYGK